MSRGVLVDFRAFDGNFRIVQRRTARTLHAELRSRGLLSRSPEVCAGVKFKLRFYPYGLGHNNKGGGKGGKAAVTRAPD